jgi:hypothetical protein
VFSVGSVPRSYKRAQSGELEEYEGVQRRSSSVQLEVGIVPVVCPVEEDDSVSVICELL